VWGRFLNRFQLQNLQVAELDGVDVMIAIFCDTFRGKKLASFWVKRIKNFAKFFAENILKTVTSVPRLGQDLQIISRHLIKNRTTNTEAWVFCMLGALSKSKWQ
jgi:hypothetical protein